MRKRLFWGTLIAFGGGTLVFAVIAVLGNLARTHDIAWLSVNGVTPMWPLAVGFGSMGLMALSLALLVVLAVVGVIQDTVVKRRARLES
ncbi:MAG: hypothetical protein ACOH14_08335 [Rhodoglobus sp.]